MFASLNDTRVLSATLSIPLVGTWVADVRIDADGTEPLPTSVVLTIGTLELHGTVDGGGPYAGSTTVRVVGGRGGLATVLPPWYYRETEARLPIGDLLREAGELLSSSSQEQALSAKLRLWTRARGRASDALTALTDELGTSWSMTPLGTVWIGLPDWAEADVEHTVIGDRPASRILEIATETPTILPGSTFLGRRIGHVRHVLTPERLRTQLHYLP